VIETARLVLRPWREDDLAPYAALMADPQVADWLGGVLATDEAAAQIAQMRALAADSGFAILAVVRKSDGAMIGSAGLAPVADDIPFAPAVEAGWRLARAAWGQGYAVEAAGAAIADGFTRLDLTEIVALTARANARSRAVMDRLGFRRDPARDFDHPRLAVGHPLRPHVVYALKRPAAGAGAPTPSGPSGHLPHRGGGGQ
jgi:RimJ/RimL family protein N-acetyltransferase